MGRALADLDPNGVGRDLMFVHDGQFGFSLFRYVASALIALFGLATAAKALAVMAALAWFFAAFAFARQFGSQAAAWTAVTLAALLPSTYGAPYPLGFAELIAIPRPFAEAFVLAALAALAARRDALCLLCLVIAALLHPIMALAGFGVFVVVRGLEEKHWFLFCVVALAVTIMGGFLGLPVWGRLFTVADPSLRSLYEQRSPFLFPSLWPTESFPPLVVQSVTIAIAAHLQHGRSRWIFSAIMLVGLSGVAIAAIFGDRFSSLLVVQAQSWRAAWLMSLVGAMALGICAVELWPRGPTARLALVFLALAWSFNTQFGVAAPALVVALVFYFGAKGLALAVNPRLVIFAWMFAVPVAMIWQFRLFAYPWQFAMTAPAGYGDPSVIFVRGYLAYPVCALGAYFAICRPRAVPFQLTGFMIVLLSAAVLFWDHRAPDQCMMEEDRPPPEIMQLIDQRKGEVLWIDGRAEAWFLFSRPQWASPLQGIPIIFSPALAAEWRSRMQFLMDLRLADQKSFAPWSEPQSTDSPRLSLDGVRQLCARGDAPAWIIVPIEEGKDPPAGIEMKLWHLPAPLFKLTKGDGEYVWQKIAAYGVIPCRGHPQRN